MNLKTKKLLLDILKGTELEIKCKRTKMLLYNNMCIKIKILKKMDL